jgi:hypothetical protein
MAASDGSDTVMYLKKVLKELEYISKRSSKVKIDTVSLY